MRRQRRKPSNRRSEDEVSSWVLRALPRLDTASLNGLPETNLRTKCPVIISWNGKPCDEISEKIRGRTEDAAGSQRTGLEAANARVVRTTARIGSGCHQYRLLSESHPPIRAKIS